MNFLFYVIYRRYSTQETPSGVAHLLCSTARCCAYDKVYNIFGFAVEELLRVF